MATMKAWQYTTASGGLEKTLFMPASGIPKPKITADQVLIQVHCAGINPADHKVPEIGLLTRAARSGTVVPGMDFCGQVVEVGSKVNDVSVGEMVFGAKLGPPNRGGSLAEYMAVSKNMFTRVPDGVKAEDAAGMGVVGLTAYLSIKPNVKEGDKVFINGGSGGTGVLSIQVAKALGCHVTTSCSGANVELCKSLGADEVLNYKETDIVEALKKKGQIFSLVVDNVASSSSLYSQSHHFLVPSGKFEQVGAEVNMATLSTAVKGKLLPGFLGGGKRKYNLFLAHNDPEAIRQIGQWIEEGKVKAVTDSVFDFEDVPKAFEKLKTHRAKGKIIIRVKKD